jgi:hypothetical protein
VRFTAEQILTAIRTPNYAPQDGQPVGFPCVVGFAVPNVAGAVGYGIVRPSKKAVIEIRASFVWTDTPAAFATRAYDLTFMDEGTFQTLQPTSSATGKVMLTQAQNVGQGGQGTKGARGVTDWDYGTCLAVVGSNNPGFRLLSQQPFYLPDSVVIFPGAIGGVMVEAVHDSRVTLSCREWPFDSSDFNL